MLPTAVAKKFKEEQQELSRAPSTAFDFEDVISPSLAGVQFAGFQNPVINRSNSQPLLYSEASCDFKEWALLEADLPRTQSVPNIAAPKEQGEGSGPVQLLKDISSQLAPTSVTIIMYSVFAVTYGSQIYTSPGLPGPEYAPDGVSAWLLSNIAGEIGTLMFTALPCALAGGAIEMLPIFHGMFTNIVTDMPAGAGPEEMMGTVLATCFVTTMGLGLFFVVVANFGVAKYLRSVPLVVLKGALFGVSIWLMMSTFSITLPHAGADTQEAWPYWSLGIVVGTALFLVDEFVRSKVVIPLMFVSIAAAPTILHLLDIVDMDDMRDNGWLVKDPNQGLPRQIWYEKAYSAYSTSLSHANWSIVAQQLPGMVGIWVTHALCALMDMKATEMISGVETHIPTEIKGLGFANIFSSLTGGSWPVYLNCSSNVSAWKLGGTRLGAIMSALGQIVLLFVAQDIVPCLPRALAGGASWWLGAVFFKETFIDIMNQHAQKSDIAVVVFMAVTMMVDGFVNALLIGLMVAMGIFTLQYSGSPVVIRSSGDARFFRSNVQRTKEHDNLIRQHYQKIWVILVDGLLMFGSSPYLTDEARRAMASEGAESILLNFRGVQGLDYSGALDLIVLGRRAASLGRRIVLTELSSDVLDTLTRAGAQLLHRPPGEGFVEGLVGLCYEEHYHTALRLCEDALLASLGKDTKATYHLSMTSLDEPLEETSQNSDAGLSLLLRTTFHENLHRISDPQAAMVFLKKLFRTAEYPPGHTLWQEGQPATLCIGVIDGEIWGLQANTNASKSRVIEVVPRGSFTGYTALFNGESYVHSAVVAPTGGRCVVAELTSEAFQEIEEQWPGLAAVMLRTFLKIGVSEIRNMSLFFTNT
mmetsp:Transcript_56455/g.123400  ORF Transcript_56455/g.123400 Transcript_56455/m.123400 type:complete len:868 (-) Transcript_56455:25-2628(-)|eukprot:CAMPEP_0206553772 /NCGR_PEP_ID=MMETSP0325_2-20121206/16813_1 /ASSEMBLY_ACC=CAM_ASM_000347 /TAXON_ID=2866 /ORGANISM="Crypthecodinium cohnii, Strain Seligo" /LENGTH=867 /DNA_ID=CAMNT_0054053777 /DNA_START=302 /DNA_END=2905 /DNA_ORIENTATION=-